MAKEQPKAVGTVEEFLRLFIERLPESVRNQPVESWTARDEWYGFTLKIRWPRTAVKAH